MTELDDHGQPLEPYNIARVGDRTVDELIGISKGLVSDKVITEDEACFLAQWLRENREYAGSWIVRCIDSRISEMLSDSVFDEKERRELFQILSQVVGGTPILEKVASFSSALPLNSPLPPVAFDSTLFCFTGAFAYAPRRICEEEVLKRGGKISKSVTKKLDYLVIGCIGSRDWIHSTYGRKIEKAVEYRDEQGVDIAIISEDHWVNYL